MKANRKYFVKSLISSVYVHKIILSIIKVSNLILYKIFNRYVKQQVSKYQYETNNKDYIYNKIIYIIPSLGVGGAERQLINLINHLSDSLNQKKYGKFEILLVCFNYKTFSNDFYLSQLKEKIRIIDFSEGVGL
jgi:hypothetical protein